MRLTLYTDYCYCALVYSGLHADRLVTRTEIADAFGISKNHLTKVVHALGRVGYLETAKGRFGGFRLGVAAESLRLGDLFRTLDGELVLSRSADGTKVDHNSILTRAFAEGVSSFWAALDAYTLADAIAWAAAGGEGQFAPVPPPIGMNGREDH